MPDPRRPRAGHRFNREPAAAAEPLGTPSRRAAIRLLDAVLRRGEPLEQALVAATRHVYGPDRGLAHAIAAEVLRHYPAGHRQPTWVAGHVFSTAVGRGGAPFVAPTDRTLSRRFYPDAWKLSPSPLLRLLDLADRAVAG